MSSWVSGIHRNLAEHHASEMKTRLCRICGKPISPALDGALCLECLDKRLNYSEDYYDTRDLARLLCLGQRQVRKKACRGQIPGKVPGIKRHLFSRDKVDAWMDAGQSSIRIPVTPRQEKASAMCRRGDHAWMADEEYQGDSYDFDERYEHMPNSVRLVFVHTCYFCGHQEEYEAD